ncbi:DUF3037 domain-containing protein [Flavihumibacter sp. R14]|nr:DUF3037 domain-containing protein [Flavihumibacter soli]
MQEKDLFEYAVIRVVPRVEREEFLNVGVILYCARQKFLQAICELDVSRLYALSGKDADVEEIKHNLRSIIKIAEGGKAGGPIGELDMPSRFRWLTATRSTVVQTSKVHPGFCSDAGETLNRLYSQLVL